MYNIRQNSKDVQKKLNSESTISVFNPKMEAVWYTEISVVSEVYSVHLHRCKNLEFSEHLIWPCCATLAV